jgi:hypothetical protein
VLGARVEKALRGGWVGVAVAVGGSVSVAVGAVHAEDAGSSTSNVRALSITRNRFVFILPLAKQWAFSALFSDFASAPPYLWGSKNNIL